MKQNGKRFATRSLKSTGLPESRYSMIAFVGPVDDGLPACSRGRWMVNVVPLPSSDSTEMKP